MKLLLLLLLLLLLFLLLVVVVVSCTETKSFLFASFAPNSDDFRKLIFMTTQIL